VPGLTLLLAVFLSLQAGAFGRATEGSILGVVTDPSWPPVANLSVQVMGEQTGFAGRRSQTMMGSMLRPRSRSGTVPMQGGLPFPGYSSQNLNDGLNASRANYVGGGAALPPSERTFNRWFNTAAYAPPPNFVLGNSGIHILDGPGFAMVDAALQKSFPIGERMPVQFRGEASNLFNRVNLGMPSAALGAGNFGTIRSLNGDARNLQLALRVQF